MELLRRLLGEGLDPHDITAWQMALRAALVYGATIVIVRASKRRFLSEGTVFDAILAVMAGAIASRTVTGHSPLLPTMAAVAALLGLHWILSRLAVRWHGLGAIIKGRSTPLIHDGVIDHEALAREHMSHHDLEEGLRRGGVSKPDDVSAATLERDGHISVVRKSRS